MVKEQEMFSVGGEVGLVEVDADKDGPADREDECDDTCCKIGPVSLKTSELYHACPNNSQILIPPYLIEVG